MNTCGKHIVQTKAISQCAGISVRTPQKHILTELLSYPSNICYEFGLCPNEQWHITGRPDGTKRWLNPNLELHSGAGVI